MKCEDFRRLIDAYIDGELDKDQVCEMLAHAQNCEKCRHELKLAEMLKSTMRGMDDDIVPPLAAQAAWRNAIKVESRKVRMKKMYKYLGTAAAALVVLVGSVSLFNPFGNSSEPQKSVVANNDSGFSFVASDGNEAAPTAMAARIMPTDEAIPAYSEMTANVKMCCDDPTAACDMLISLTQEFGGVTDTPSNGESGAYVTAYIPSDNIEAFMDALTLAGEVTDSQLSGEGATVTVAITIKAAE